jgi:hypothetical protein
MDKAKTIEVIEALANGIDPLTGELLPEDHLLQQPGIVRALFNAVSLLKSSKDADPGLARQGSSWPADEDEQLKQAFANGTKIAQIAKDHQRTIGAIRSRLKKLGVINDGNA